MVVTTGILVTQPTTIRAVTAVAITTFTPIPTVVATVVATVVVAIVVITATPALCITKEIEPKTFRH